MGERAAVARGPAKNEKEEGRTMCERRRREREREFSAVLRQRCRVCDVEEKVERRGEAEKIYTEARAGLGHWVESSSASVALVSFFFRERAFSAVRVQRPRRVRTVMREREARGRGESRLICVY